MRSHPACDDRALVARHLRPMLRILNRTASRACLESMEYTSSGLPLRPHVSSPVLT
jgi:hypothetical protein